MPDRIGQFHLKRLIASGGMGSVYEAIQHQPRRTVAVKIMKQGLSTSSARRRFEYEAQILARLRHPGIAQIYEAGTHKDPEGLKDEVPYFAMEYIPNAQSITAYARSRNLELRPRLELFTHVCDAVHHGHQKGIIHRDLKPANILVDSTGQIKIIDFGVARATDSDMAITTIQTDVGQLIGTIQYMSPEQVQADPHDLDIRSDIYSLGVILFELLTGDLPYDVSSVPMIEATRLVLNQDPPRLSVIDASLRGDVETIVRTAMEKDRDRRYQSAKGLANDINAFLNHDPISARPPSMTYQLRTFAKKHKPVVLGVATVMLALAIGIVITTTAMIQARRAQALAEQLTLKAETDRERMVADRDEKANQLKESILAADREIKARIEAEAVTEFIAGMFSAVDPVIHGRDVTVRRMLDIAGAKIEANLQEVPLLRARLHHIVGGSYLALGDFDLAEPHLAEAESLHRKLLTERDERTQFVMGDLADAYVGMGRYEPAESLLLELREIRRNRYGPDDKATLRTANNLARLYWTMHRYEDAERLLVDTARRSEQSLGATDPGTLMSLANLAALNQEMGRYEQAENLFRHVLESLTRTLPDDHPNVLAAMSNLGVLYEKMERYDESEAMLRTVLQRQIKVYGERHLQTLTTRRSLAKIFLHRNQPEQAAGMLQDVLEAQRSLLATAHPNHPELLVTSLDLANAYDALDRHDEAERIERDVLEVRRRLYAVNRLEIAHVLILLGRTLIHQQRFADAERAARDCLDIREKELPDGHKLIVIARSVLGETLAGQSKFAEAEPLLLQSHERIRDLPDVTSAIRLESLERLIALYESWGREDEAETYRGLLRAGRDD